MKRSQSGVRETAQDDHSRRNNDDQKRTSGQFPEPSTNVTRRSFAQEGTIRPEYSPDEAINTRHTSVETSQALHSIHRLEEPRRPRYVRHKFTSSMASSPPARPCPSNVTEEIIVWSGIAKHRLTSPENEVRRRSYENTKQAIAPTAPEDLEHYLEDVYDESQSRKLPKQEIPGRLSLASEKRGRYNGSHRVPETGCQGRQEVAATCVDEQSRHKDSSQMQVLLLTGAQPVSIISKSPTTLDYFRTRRRPVATSRLSMGPPRDTKDRASSNAAFVLPGTLQGDGKTSAVKAMGDVVCYTARSSKIQMESTTTSSRSRRRSSSATRSSQDLSSQHFPLVRMKNKFPPQTPSSIPPSSSSSVLPSVLPSSSSTDEVHKPQRSTPPSVVVDRSTPSLSGGLEDRRHVPPTYHDRRQLEVFVDITRRHRAAMTEPTLATPSRSDSWPTSFVEHISAAVRIRPGGVTSSRGPSKQSDDSQFTEKRKMSFAEGHPVDFRSFLPESEEALPYTELLHYPKHRSEEAPKAVKERLPSEPEVDLGRFLFSSKEALPYTELLDYPKPPPEKAPESAEKKGDPDPKVNLEKFMPHSKEALAYTELLQYPKRPPEKAPNSAMKEMKSHSDVDLERFMPHSKEALAYTELLEYPKRGSKVKTLPRKVPSQPTSRRTSLAQTIGPAKREITPPPKPRSRVPDHPGTSKPAGPPPRPLPPTSRGQKIVSLRPYVASFQGANEGGEEADTTPGLSPASAVTLSMMPPPEDSHGFIRPFYMTVQGNLDEQQPAQELSKKASVEPPWQLVERPSEKPLVKRIEKPTEKPPVPETGTASGVRRRLPLKLRPFRGAVHDTNETTSRAKPLITEKKVAPPVARTAASAPATRSFAMNVRSSSGRLGPRRVSATRIRATSRGPAKTAPIHIHDSSINITKNLSDTSKLATPSKDFLPVPPGMRIISMSTGPTNFRETMLWDFSPAPPMKVPQLHSKRVSIAPTETPKIGTIVASKSLPKDNKSAISAPSTARASKDTVAVPVRPPTRTEVSPKKDEKQASAPQRGKPSEEAVTERVPSVSSASKASKETTLPPAKRAGHAEANTAKAGRPPSTSCTRKDSKEAAAPVKTAVHGTASTAKTEEPLSTSTVAQNTPSTSSTATKEALKPAVHVAPSSSKAEKAASEAHSAKYSAPAIAGSIVPPSVLKDASATVVKSQQQPQHSATKDLDKRPFASSSAKHPQEMVPKPATTTAPPDHTTAATGAITAASVVPAPAATTAATSEKSQLESSANMPLSEVVLAHAKVEAPKPATAAVPVKAPPVKSILHKPPSQEIVPRRHSVATIAPQATPKERENAVRDAKIASNVKPSDRERHPSSSRIAIRAVVRTTTQGESKALIPRPAATPAKRPSADAETGIKLEAKPVPEPKPPLPAQPPIPCRPYKACIQGTGTDELPKEPQREMHPLRVPDSKALIPLHVKKSHVVPVEQPRTPPEEPRPPPPAKKEPPEPPPKPCKPPPPPEEELPPKPPPEVPKKEPVSHPVRNFRAMVKSARKRKAQGRHKCAKHKDETSSQYERRKSKVIAKRKAKAKADALKKAEKELLEIKLLREKLNKTHKCRCARKVKQERSESTAQGDDQKSDMTNRRKKGDKKTVMHRVPSESYAERKTSPFILCCVCLIALIIVGLLAALIWHEKEAVTTTTGSTPVTFTPSYTKIYYCSSDVCKAEAEYIKSLLSANKNPCNNFYEYVCDRWNKIHPVPSMGAGGAQSVDTILQDKLLINLEPLLLGVPDRDVRVAADLYENCLRRDQVGDDGDIVIGVVRQFFRDWAIKEWPVIKPDAITTSVAWTFAGELVRDLNVAALTSVSIGVSLKALERVSIELDNPRLLLSCNDASRPVVMDLFSGALTELMSRFAASSSKKNVEEVMRVFVRIGSSPAIAARPDSGPLSYTLIKLIDLDHGYTQLLERVFGGIISIDGMTEVVVKSTDYVRNYLTQAMQELPAHAVANYLGFLALAKMAPFFPEKFASLRQIFAKDVLDRTLPDVSQTKTLCLLAVQQLLPRCFSKAATQLRGMWGAMLPLSDWLARLQSSFSRHQDLVAWIDELSALIVRYRLKRNRMVSLSTGYSEPCAPAPSEIPRRSEHPLRFFHQVSMLQEQKRLQMILKDGRDVLAQSGEPRSELMAVPDYEVMRQLVHVSMVLFNTSVPTNATLFSFHLSRVAVRVYRALVQLLFPNIYERDAPITLGDDARRQLERLLSCFEDDLRQLPTTVRGPVSIDSAKSRGALLQHVVAIKLALRAFDDNLNVRRIWRVDYRFQDLPNVSSDALFFIYYALDNCESADTVYAEHRGQWLPAHYRVNAALRHVDEFAREFGCTSATDMASGTSMCNVLKRH